MLHVTLSFDEYNIAFFKFCFLVCLPPAVLTALLLLLPLVLSETIDNKTEHLDAVHGLLGLSRLVSSVTTAVTQQLSALLPSPSAAPSTNSQSSSTTYPVVQSVSSDHAATLVQDALDDVHSTISGQPRPFNLTEQLPTQPFYSATLPLDARVPEKIKEKNMEGRVCRFRSFAEQSRPNRTL